MNKWATTLLIGVLALAAVSAGLLSSQFFLGGADENVVGGRAPEFVLNGLDGEAVSARQFAGQPLVINLWATWCPPCVREIPALVDFQQQWGEQITVLGVAYDNAEAVREFLPRFEVNYPIALADPFTDTLSAQLGNERDALPYTALVDANGIVRAVHSGEMNAEHLQEWAALLQLQPEA
jgi:thiol-disulfide isomerase/thioredoxin